MAKYPKNEELDDQLILAVKSNWVQQVSALLHHNAHVDCKEKTTPLLELALIHKSRATVPLLLNAGVNVNYKNFFPLIYVCMQNDLELTNLLLRAGAHIDCKNSHGLTPLMIASIYGYFDLVSLLVDAGAQLNIKDYHKKTALNHALEYSKRFKAQRKKHYLEKENKSKLIADLLKSKIQNNRSPICGII
ncbi:MAG: ankyrin repeat domain-containing protein [Candidatus Dependentiae bacterium]|nr:ankyrin repeat domain-containing protein [Candidatus Dependentiae bacterium]